MMNGHGFRRLILIAIGLLGALIGLYGCADEPQCPGLPGGPVYCLQATDGVPPFHVLQDIRIRRGDLDERMIAQVEVDPGSMRLAGLTPMGQRIFDTRFDNRAATSDSIAGDRFDPRVLLALVQLANWPLERVAQGFASEIRIEQTGFERRFLRGEEVFLEIARTGRAPHYSTIEIRIPMAELTVTIETIDEDE